MTDRDDGSKPDYELQEDSKAGAIEAPKDADGKLIEGEKAAGGVEMGPGVTGWAPQFGWPVESVMEGESLLDHQTWLEGKIPDKYYGGAYPIWLLATNKTCEANTNIMFRRLVLQRRGHCVRLYRFVASSSFWRRPRMGLYRYGLLWDILPDFDSTSSPQFSRRLEPRAVTEETGDRYGVPGVDKLILGEILAYLPACVGGYYH